MFEILGKIFRVCIYCSVFSLTQCCEKCFIIKGVKSKHSKAFINMLSVLSWWNMKQALYNNIKNTDIGITWYLPMHVLRYSPVTSGKFISTARCRVISCLDKDFIQTLWGRVASSLKLTRCCSLKYWEFNDLFLNKFSFMLNVEESRLNINAECWWSPSKNVIQTSSFLLSHFTVFRRK